MIPDRNSSGVRRYLQTSVESQAQRKFEGENWAEVGLLVDRSVKKVERTN